MIFLCAVVVQCGDSKTAEDLFERCSQKSIHLYGAMMKGEIKHCPDDDRDACNDL